MNEPNLGDRVKCTVTGIIGLVLAKSPTQVAIQPPAGEDGLMPTPVWSVFANIEVLQEKIFTNEREE